MKISKILIGVFVLVLMVTIFTVSEPDAMAYEYVGQCGASVAYIHLDYNLTITGTGAMYDYSSSNPPPWQEVAGDIRSITFIGNVTTIGDYAFAGFTSLQTISGASAVKTIGSHAFDGCTSLTNMPQNVYAIGSYAFENCTSLRSAVSGSSLGTGAFYNCKSLNSISFSSGLSQIKENTFFNCYSLGSVNLPGGLTEIGESAFENCSGLRSIGVISNVTAIGTHAFKGCSSLTTFTIPDGVDNLADEVFVGCSSLESVVIHKNVKSLGVNAFADCTDLLRVILPASIIEMGEGLFSGCTSLRYVTLENGITALPDKAFSGCTSLNKLTLPNSMESIGSEAFSGCTALTEITLNEGLSEIGDNVFQGCTVLTSCVMPSSIKTIGNSVFVGCTALKSVKYTGYRTRWERVTVGSGNILLSYDNIDTEYIDGDSLNNSVIWSVSNDGCLYLSGRGSVSDFDPDEETPWSKYSDEIVSVSIDERITYIGAYTFAGLDQITSATLPEGTTQISQGLFRDCTGLESVAGLDGVKNIKESAFENCISLSIDIPPALTLGDRTFAGCEALNNITLSSEKIGKEAFVGCKDLGMVIVKNTVLEIGDRAFYGCTLDAANFVGVDNELNALVIGAGNESLSDVLDIYYYIKNIYIGYGSSKSSAKASVSNRADGILNINLTPKGDGYVYLGYALTSDIEEALTDIKVYVTSAEQMDMSLMSDNITYYLLSSPVATDENGRSVYLCTTKDPSAGEPIRMVGIYNMRTNRHTFKYTDESWTLVNNINSGSSSLNGEAEDVRLYFTSDMSADISQVRSYAWLITIVIVVLVLAATVVTDHIFLKKKNKSYIIVPLMTVTAPTREKISVKLSIWREKAKNLKIKIDAAIRRFRHKFAEFTGTLHEKIRQKQRKDNIKFEQKINKKKGSEKQDESKTGSGKKKESSTVR